jgi:hypothetical protein
LHRERQRFVVEGFGTATRVLHQHDEVILILSESPNAAALVHDYKQQDFAIRRSHLTHK